jgi:hypothetical protein
VVEGHSGSPGGKALQGRTPKLAYAPHVSRCRSHDRAFLNQMGEMSKTCARTRSSLRDSTRYELAQREERDHRAAFSDALKAEGHIDLSAGGGELMLFQRGHPWI